MPFITLLTDFGYRDGYPGVMKGVIWGICPEAEIADITHVISPQNVMEGALALGRVAGFFPAGTVHIAVVDPGVGTHRRPVALRLGDDYYVGPDNGLFTVVLEQAEQKNKVVEIVHLNKSEYWLPEISNVFHGRDIFAPVGAHLARGVPLREVGALINDPVRLSIPRPQRYGSGWSGQITSIDFFGNLETNLTRDQLTELGQVLVRIGGVEIRGLVNTFGERPVGELIALYGTHNDLIVSVVNGNAQAKLNVKVGDKVEVFPLESEK